MACFVSGTTNQQKFGGVGGYTLENFFSTDLHELEKQPKTKVGGGKFPLLPPLAAPLERVDEEKAHRMLAITAVEKRRRMDF